MRICALVASAVFFLSSVGDVSQASATEKGLRLAAGLGFSLPHGGLPQTTGARGSGAFANAEYILKMSEWFSPRAYGGFLLTSPEQGSCGARNRNCDVSASVVFAGAKMHMMAPFPKVGPFSSSGSGLRWVTFQRLSGEPNITARATV